MTLASAIDQLGPTGTTLTTFGPTTLNGAHVLGVRAKTATSNGIELDTLYAHASGRPLPVEEDVTQGTNRFSIAFDHWNDAIHVTVPKHTVPIATVEAAGSGPSA